MLQQSVDRVRGLPLYEAAHRADLAHELLKISVKCAHGMIDHRQG